MAYGVPLRRRLFLSAVALLGCGGATDESETDLNAPHTATSVTPWHLWGNQRTLDFAGQATVAPPIPTSQQMLKVAYKRPESWHFLFSCKVLASTVAAGGGGVNVSWDLKIGIGLNTIEIPGFVTQGFPLVGAPSDLIQIWSMTAKQPPQFGGDTSDSRVSTFVAQDIQLAATITFFTASASTVKLQLEAQVAPVVHMRPDWFAHEFAGEMGGH